MSNVLTSNPIKLDTTGATSSITNGLRIIGFVWDSGDSGTVGDNVVLHDASGGNVVFQATLAVAKDTIIFNPAKPLDTKGLYLTTIDNGVLLVYLA